jgi:hypothetical protein
MTSISLVSNTSEMDTCFHIRRPELGAASPSSPGRAFRGS